MLFALGILTLFGILQATMIKPYYRNAKINDVKYVANQIQNVIIDNNNRNHNMNRINSVSV